MSFLDGQGSDQPDLIINTECVQNSAGSVAPLQVISLFVSAVARRPYDPKHFLFSALKEKLRAEIGSLKDSFHGVGKSEVPEATLIW